MLFDAVSAVHAPLTSYSCVAPKLPAAQWSTGARGSRIDLANFKLKFADEFTEPLDVADYKFRGPVGAHKWYAYGKFGAVKMAGATTKPAPLVVADGVLTLRLQRVGFRWRGVEIQTFNPAGEGFSLPFGYFEARIRLPKAMPVGVAPWPAFWVWSRYTQDQVRYGYSELDILENFGARPSQLSLAAHEWPPRGRSVRPPSPVHSKQLLLNASIHDGRWHTYGLDINDCSFIVYMDSYEIARFPRWAGHPKGNFYPILDVGASSSPSLFSRGSYDMQVDHVRVYEPEVPRSLSSIGRRRQSPK